MTTDRELLELAAVVDQVFDGAIEDASIIEEIYSAVLVARPKAPAVGEAKPVAWRFPYKFRDIGETGAHQVLAFR